MHEEKSGDTRWDESNGMLCHTANSLLGLREGSEGRAGTRDKERKHCGKISVFYKSFNLSLL